MEERKFIVNEIEKEKFVHIDSICEYKCWYVVHTDYGGYTENELEIFSSKDRLFLCGTGEGRVYLYKEQVDLLKKILLENNL